MIELELHSDIGTYMDNRTSIEILADRVSQILQINSSLKEEVEAMRMELVTLKAEKELKNTEIDRLVEENLKKDIEIEEIVSKIETIIG